jgi:hypothetical protein
MLLKISNANDVIIIMERSLNARISPISSIPLKYISTLSEMAKIPHQKQIPMAPSKTSL